MMGMITYESINFHIMFGHCSSTYQYHLSSLFYRNIHCSKTFCPLISRNYKVLQNSIGFMDLFNVGFFKGKWNGVEDLQVAVTTL